MSALYLDLMKEKIAESITDAIQQLLENKHLYQNLDVNYPDLGELIEEYIRPKLSGFNLTKDHEVAIEADYVLSKFEEWRIFDTYGEKGYLVTGNSDGIHSNNIIYFKLPTVRTFCAHCKNKQPYNFRFGLDTLDSFRENVVNNDSSITQVFIFLYQCQGCKELPEVFMVRRKNMKLTLCGRSPMETVEVPDVLPKNQHKFFSGATVAFNSGQVLAAIFLIRTFIEQYVRSVNSNPLSRNIDAIFSDYSSGLPTDFKDRFPSLESVYYDLSEDIHSATGSEDVFLEAKDDIIEHFEAKRIFKI